MAFNYEPTPTSKFAALSATLVNAIIKNLIPGDATLGVPGALEIDILTLLHDDSNWEHQIHKVINNVVEHIFNGELPNEENLNEALEEFSARTPKKWSVIVNPIIGILMSYYYSDQQVRQAIGVSSLPPFPLGNEIQSIELDILSPVYERGRIYRLPLGSSEWDHQ